MCIGNRAIRQQKIKSFLHISCYWHDFLMFIINKFLWGV